MFSSVRHAVRLIKAGRTLARYDALLQPQQLASLPWFARLALRMARFGARSPAGDPQSRLAAALTALGPSYIKLGQFLATRPDVIGPDRAFELKALQDRLPPFGMDQARIIIHNNFGTSADVLFRELSEPVAAASIAQVHRGLTEDGREVAVKVLRPGVEKRFAADLDSFYFAARLMEKFSAEGRRLRPVAAVRMLEESMKLELDLRMEASAISEMAENIKEDTGFRVPAVDWQRTSRQVLTTGWISGTPIADVAALRAKGFNLIALGDTVIQSFLRHAIRDGFFHADMHPGNLFIDDKAQVVAVDFGITGRLGRKESLFLAEILFGFITRDYLRVAQVHFDAGYVPNDQDPNSFAQALRAIGEPIMDKSAKDISMARLLTQLFEVTSQFNMSTQPQLLLLQKTMVVVEGVARTLNPDLNMWVTAEPVVRHWIERKLGPVGRVEAILTGAADMALRLPALLTAAENATLMLSDMARRGGLRLDQETVRDLAKHHGRQNRLVRIALVAGALALMVIAWQISR